MLCPKIGAVPQTIAALCLPRGSLNRTTPDRIPLADGMIKAEKDRRLDKNRLGLARID